MGVNITPHERDVANISRLSVNFNRGGFETPNRFVMRHDLNAKSGIGADIDLTSKRNLFICEEEINEDVLNDLSTRNGFLGEFKSILEKPLDRVESTKSLKAVFPKVIKKVKPLMSSDGSTRDNVTHFVLDLMSELDVDLYLLQVELLSDPVIKYLGSLGRQYAPIFDIHDYKNIVARLPNFIDESPDTVPFIGFTFALYPNAYLAYRYVMSNMEKIHEKNKGILSVEIPRNLGNENSTNVDTDISAPHYSSFLISDITAEIYRPKRDIKKKKGPEGDSNAEEPRRYTRIFEKKDLALPVIAQGCNPADHEGEDDFLGPDENLRKLFWRTLSLQNTPEDRRKNRPGFMSRIHESLMTTVEYENMQKSILNHELLEYRRNKIRMNDLLTQQSL